MNALQENSTMARRPADPGANADAPKLAPRRLTKAEFGKRLHTLIVRKGWTQSELARRADLPRDSISTYVRGAVFPTRHSLEKLAKALGVEADALLPNLVETTMSRQPPAFEMRQAEGEPGRVWLKVDRLVSFATAVKIAALLESDDAFATN
jgi:transcriptional regulator with XRE-family HTH domain